MSFGDWSSSSTLLIESVHSGQRTTSIITLHTCLGGAAISITRSILITAITPLSTVHFGSDPHTYRRTAVPPYRRTALPPYRLSAFPPLPPFLSTLCAAQYP